MSSHCNTLYPIYDSTCRQRAGECCRRGESATHRLGHQQGCHKVGGLSNLLSAEWKTLSGNTGKNIES